MRHLDLRVVVLRDVVGTRQAHRLAGPFHILQHIEKAFQHPVGAAESAPEARDGAVLKEALHAGILQKALEHGVSCHLVVVQGEAPLGAVQLDHRAAPGRFQGEPGEAVDIHLQRVAQVVLQCQGLQLLERNVRQSRRQSPRRLRGCHLQHVAGRLQAPARGVRGAAGIAAGAPDDEGPIRPHFEIGAGNLHSHSARRFHGAISTSTHLLGHLCGRQRKSEHSSHEDQDHDGHAGDDFLHHAPLLLNLLVCLGRRGQLGHPHHAAAIGVPFTHDFLDAFGQVLVRHLLGIEGFLLHQLREQCHAIFHFLIAHVATPV
mmetsp:Transcript_52242/g.125088  ORF Transcript_52242/g.125088 Transcript_52242/m.125088 type:complete len:317 (-) Transcript_52242:285-1235(-)